MVVRDAGACDRSAVTVVGERKRPHAGQPAPELTVMMNGLLWRAVPAFLVLPGMVAFLVPWLLLESGQVFDRLGLLPLGLGVVLLLWGIT